MNFNKSAFSLDDKGELLNTVITSKLLIPEGTEIQIPYVKNNLHENIDYYWLERKKSSEHTYQGYENGNCPNIFIGSDRKGKVHEIFQPRNSCFVKIKPHDEPLIITIDDLKRKFKISKKGGAFGRIYFLKDFRFDNDHLSRDKNKGLKEDLVVKKQTRKTKLGSSTKGNKCFAFNELSAFLMNRLRTDRFHSDLYIDHFYAPSVIGTKKLDLFIIMKRCDSIVSDLIDLVHGSTNVRNKRNFKTINKFPTIILINLIHTFFTQGGAAHNDIKGENMGYIRKKDGTVVCRFIDFGSKNGSGECEMSDAKYSKFPSTILFLSPNKTPKPGSGIVIMSDEDSDDDDNMANPLDMLSQMDETEGYETLNKTCRQALPNYKEGAADNLWAMAILILECIFGKNPVIEYGLTLDDVFNCIHEKDFYSNLKESDVYKHNYQFDEDFKIVAEFLKRSLDKDPKKRDKYYHKIFNSNGERKFEVNSHTLKLQLSYLGAKFG